MSWLSFSNSSFIFGKGKLRSPYGICQIRCNTVVIACYAGAGLTFGTVTVTAGAGIPAAAIACSSVVLAYVWVAASPIPSRE